MQEVGQIQNVYTTKVQKPNAMTTAKTHTYIWKKSDCRTVSSHDQTFKDWFCVKRRS